SGPRRIRTWAGSGAQNAVGLVLNPDFTITVEIGGLGVGTTETPLSPCGATAPYSFTELEVQYASIAARRFVIVRVNCHVEFSAPHASTVAINSSRIGFDSIGPALDIVWDDHTLSRGLVWPEDIRILGLIVDADGFYLGWSAGTTGCGQGAYSCVDQVPPTD